MHEVRALPPKAGILLDLEQNHQIAPHTAPGPHTPPASKGEEVLGRHARWHLHFNLALMPHPSLAATL